MPVKIDNVQDTNSFDSGYVNFPIGNAGQWKKRIIDVYAGVSTESTQSSTLTIRTNNVYGLTPIERVEGSWIDEGYKVGDTIYMYTNVTAGASPPNTFPFLGLTIEEITDTVIYVGGLNYQVSQSFPGQYQTENGSGDQVTITLNWAIVYKILPPTDLTLKFNQLPNNDIDGASMNSIIDGSQAVLRVSNIDASDLVTVVDMEQLGNKSGSTILNPTIVGMGVGTGVEAWKSFFRVEFYYKISGEFEDADNYDSEGDTPEFYLNNNCLSSNFEFEFRSSLSDPNFTMRNDPTSKETKKLGNTGWKNENYNGGTVNSTIEDVEYKYLNSTGDIITEPLYNNDTYVEITINDPDADLTDSKYGFQFMYVPLNSEQYKTNEFNESENLLINTVREQELIPLVHTASPVTGTFQGFTNSVGARMDVKNPHLQVNGTTVTLSLTLSPNTEFNNYMMSQDDGNRLCSLQVSVGIPNVSQQASNRVRLIADSPQMERYLESLGEYPNLSSRFYKHNEGVDDLGTQSVNAYIMDDLKQYAIIPAEFGSEYKIIAVNTQIKIVNSVTGESGTLEDERKDLTGYPYVNEIVEANGDEGLRGFTLDQSNTNNWFRCNRRSDLDNASYWYLDYWYAFRLRFEDWVGLDNLPDELYVETDQLTNFNENWLNKQLTDWELKYYFYIEVEKEVVNTLTGDVTTEVARFENVYDINVNDYESGALVGEVTAINPNGDNTFVTTDPEIYNKNVNGIDCDGLNEFTITFTSVATIPDISYVLFAYADLYAYKQGSIFSSYQLSNAVTNLLGGNPLEPITGTTPTVTLVDPNTVTVEFNINPNNLPVSNDLSYYIGGRLEIAEGLPVNGKRMEDGTQKIEEDSTIKIIE